MAVLARAASSTGIDTSPFRASTAHGPLVEKFGPYLVYEQLGEGGMAYVHRAELVGAGGFRKTVALKRMKTVTAECPDFVTSFIHEGRLAGRLKHPNIAQAYELGKLDGTYYIAMELVLGPTLAQIMAQSRRAAGAVPLPIVLELLIQLCDALDHAHDLRDDGGKPLNLVHRDISPMNIIVSRTGVAKLIDFGIAKARSNAVVTQAGVVKGKHAYVAPEYLAGTCLDRRADLWALGVVAHELICGRRLFLGDNEAETIKNVRTLAIQPPSRLASNISVELDDIVMTALQRDPSKRWQNAGAMRVALTEEARRLRSVVSGAQIRDWVEWAFRQPTHEHSPLNAVLADLEPSISICSDDLMVAASGEIHVDEDAPTVDAKRPSPARIEVSSDLRPTPRFATNVPSLGFAPRARIATGTVPPVDAVPEPVIAAGSARMARDLPRPSFSDRVTPRVSPDELLLEASAGTERATPRMRYRADGIPVRDSTAKVRPPARWNPPTRWTRDSAPTQAPQLFVLLMLLAFAAMAVALGWIDVDRWRSVLGL